MGPLSIVDISSFGGTAAEDDDLKRFFVRTPAFESIWQGEKSVVVGRKGSGKTALYLALVERAKQEGLLAAPLSFSEYPWQAHYRYVSSETNSTERFVDSWRFLILAEALSLIIRRTPDGLTRQQNIAVGEVREFLEKNYGSSEFDFKKAFPVGGLEVQGLNVGPSAMGVAVGSARIERSTQALGSGLGRINAWLVKKAEAIGPRLPETFILFDELDLGFNPGDSDYRDRVIGLLLAVRSFRREISRRKHKANCISTLRHFRPTSFWRQEQD